MNIVLVGYRGTGKTVVGELLSVRLQMPCIGMDAKIVKRAGMSIPEIVEKYGWLKFRELESEEARELAGLDNVIIDTGGGVVERPENIEGSANKLPHFLAEGFGGCNRCANSKRHPAAGLDFWKNVYGRGLRSFRTKASQI